METTLSNLQVFSKLMSVALRYLPSGKSHIKGRQLNSYCSFITVIYMYVLKLIPSDVLDTD